MNIAYFLQCQGLKIEPININSFLSNLVPSLIGAGAALLVFYLTTKNAKNKEERKNIAERQDKITYLKSLISSLIVITKQQKGNIESHIKKIENDNVNFHLMAFVPLTDFVRTINVLSKEEYYSAFLKEYRTKLNAPKIYNRFISNIDFLHAQFIEVPEILRKSQAFDYERKLQHKRTVDDSAMMIERFLFLIRNNHPAELASMTQIFSDFQKGLNDHYDISYYNEKFILPMKTFLANFINTTNLNVPEEILMMANSLRVAGEQFEFIIDSNKKLSEDIAEIKEQIGTTLKELIENKDLL